VPPPSPSPLSPAPYRPRRAHGRRSLPPPARPHRRAARRTHRRAAPPRPSAHLSSSPPRVGGPPIPTGGSSSSSWPSARPRQPRPVTASRPRTPGLLPPTPHAHLRPGAGVLRTVALLLWCPPPARSLSRARLARRAAAPAAPAPTTPISTHPSPHARPAGGILAGGPDDSRRVANRLHRRAPASRLSSCGHLGRQPPGSPPATAPSRQLSRHRTVLRRPHRRAAGCRSSSRASRQRCRTAGPRCRGCSRRQRRGERRARRCPALPVDELAPRARRTTRRRRRRVLRTRLAAPCPLPPRDWHTIWGAQRDGGGRRRSASRRSD